MGDRENRCSQSRWPIVSLVFNREGHTIDRVALYLYILTPKKQHIPAKNRHSAIIDRKILQEYSRVVNGVHQINGVQDVSDNGIQRTKRA